MVNVSEAIDALGGTSAVARALSIPASTVSSWKAAGRIPNWRLPTLAKMAKAKGAVDLHLLLKGERAA